jgi:hypothetical protein
MARKKSEKSFIKEIKSGLQPVFIESFASTVPVLAKKYGMEITSKEVSDRWFQGSFRRVNLVGLTLDQLGKYILNYPSAVIEADYSFPHFHNKTMDSMYIKIDGFTYTEDNREELEEEIAKWMYQLYEKSSSKEED